MTAGCTELSLAQAKSPARDAAEELLEGFRLAGRLMTQAKSTHIETQGIFPTLMGYIDAMEDERAALLSALKAMDAALTSNHGDVADGDKREGLDELLGEDVCEAWIQIRSAITQADVL